MISIGIAHAAWATGRDKSLSNLMQDLGSSDGVFTCSSTEKEHASIWARRLWEVGYDSVCDHLVFLNDDVRVPKNFRAACEAIVAAVPDKIISLHGSTPVPACRWTRAYWITGPGYIVPRERLRQLLNYCDDHPELVKGTNEDNVIMQMLWHQQDPGWLTNPGMVVHDQTVVSTLGWGKSAGEANKVLEKEIHPLRDTNVPWTNTPDANWADPAFWAYSGRPPLIECPWTSRDQLRLIETRNGKPPECAFCMTTKDIVTESTVTAAGLCRNCVLDAVTSALTPSVFAK